MPKKKSRKKQSVPEIQEIPIEDIKYCNSTNIRMTEEEALFILQSGNTFSAFAFTPSHFKRLAEAMTDAIGQYEKKSGKKIDTHKKRAK